MVSAPFTWSGARPAPRGDPHGGGELLPHWQANLGFVHADTAQRLPAGAGGPVPSILPFGRRPSATPVDRLPAFFPLRVSGECWPVAADPSGPRVCFTYKARFAAPSLLSVLISLVIPISSAFPELVHQDEVVRQSPPPGGTEESGRVRAEVTAQQATGGRPFFCRTVRLHGSRCSVTSRSTGFDVEGEQSSLVAVGLIHAIVPARSRRLPLAVMRASRMSCRRQLRTSRRSRRRWPRRCRSSPTT